MEKPKPSEPIPIPKPPDTPVKPKSKAGRKRIKPQRMTIIQMPVIMEFN